MLKLEQVGKTYREGRLVVQALRDVNLELAAEGFTVLVGPSGSGKSTLLNLMGALDRPTEGRVLLQGVDTTTLDERRLTALRAEQVGFVFQSFNLMPVLSALENVEYGLAHARTGAGQRRRQAQEALEQVGLAEQAGHRPDQLSGGQRQRVAIARALVKRPALVLADEPTANLDSENAQAVVDLMRRMHRECRTRFVFSTHDPNLLRQADHVLEARDGRVSVRAAVQAPGAQP